MPRSKGDVRRRLQKAALALYRERGYDAATTAEIASQAGVTERTFFRHFKDKREVLFDEAAFHAALEAAIAKAPDDLGPLEVLLWAFRALEKLFHDNRPMHEAARDVIAATPALRERQLAKAASTIVIMAAALERRGVAPQVARVAAATGMAVAGDALEAWYKDPSSGLKAHLDRAFRTLRNLSADTPRSKTRKR